MGMGPMKFEERWVVVANRPDYRVSDFGRVKSVKYGKEKFLAVSTNPKSGVLQVTLFTDGKRETKGVHTLVLESFVGPCPVGLEGCHNDGNPSNNHLGNLRWDTRSSNQLDAVNQGTHAHARLKPSDIPLVWDRLVKGDSWVDIANDFRVAIGTINDIRSGRTWKQYARAV